MPEVKKLRRQLFGQFPEIFIQEYGENSPLSQWHYLLQWMSTELPEDFPLKCSDEIK
jgi:hypothetical protein